MGVRREGELPLFPRSYGEQGECELVREGEREPGRHGREGLTKKRNGRALLYWLDYLSGSQENSSL